MVRRAPDAVLLPDSHEQVEALVRLAHQRNFCLIPFGGGTNIVGGINPEADEARPMMTLSLRNMNRLISLDPESRTATIQAGALGPKLEADLAEHGHSLGHYPDSFEYSTLGGWLATRSAGMQSDAYGRIEDMVVSIKMVTPSGTIVTKAVPSSSAGPDLNRIMVGSEGILGVITEATMRVHKTPAIKDYRGYLFKSFEDGVRAIQECLDRGVAPSMIRLQDSGESELAFNMKAPQHGLAGLDPEAGEGLAQIPRLRRALHPDRRLRGRGKVDRGHPPLRARDTEEPWRLPTRQECRQDVVEG